MFQKIRGKKPCIHDNTVGGGGDRGSGVDDRLDDEIAPRKPKRGRDRPRKLMIFLGSGLLFQNCSIKRLANCLILPNTFEGGLPRIRLQIAVLQIELIQETKIVVAIIQIRLEKLTVELSSTGLKFGNFGKDFFTVLSSTSISSCLRLRLDFLFTTVVNCELSSIFSSVL
ncbi:hypothetical protein DERP_009860 [Dermatophagoides pteronyssinus]|uniref:Uncharacterized protein n=1 Tax=Dermatophagoides pteronyssinus TaxID=6956 RepID=A0ABQ8IRC4_DERPT|nr:hypothetical protein DERP_009860 [Dermatophagoides pteronyssinus]